MNQGPQRLSSPSACELPAGKDTQGSCRFFRALCPLYLPPLLWALDLREPPSWVSPRVLFGQLWALLGRHDLVQELDVASNEANPGEAARGAGSSGTSLPRSHGTPGPENGHPLSQTGSPEPRGNQTEAAPLNPTRILSFSSTSLPAPGCLHAICLGSPKHRGQTGAPGQK